APAEHRPARPAPPSLRRRGPRGGAVRSNPNRLSRFAPPDCDARRPPIHPRRRADAPGRKRKVGRGVFLSLSVVSCPFSVVICQRNLHLPTINAQRQRATYHPRTQAYASRHSTGNRIKITAYVVIDVQT